MNKTKQQIEEVIKKNLPERKDGSLKIPQGNPIDGYSSKTEREKGFNLALSQINTSLTADEVLKVVVETLRNNIDKIQKYTGGSSVEPKDIRVKLKDVLQLLSNLSPNKENKNI